MYMNLNASVRARRRLAMAAWLTGLSVALVLAAGAFSCSTSPQGAGQDPPIDDPDAFWVNATVEFTPLEGGCWTLAVEDKTYEPINLAQEFREDGLQVRAALKPRVDMATICQVGQIVEVLSIRSRSG
jgi:hypothetical protein